MKSFFPCLVVLGIGILACLSASCHERDKRSLSALRDVQVGSPRSVVITRLGTPDHALAEGGREVLAYGGINAIVQVLFIQLQDAVVVGYRTADSIQEIDAVFHDNWPTQKVSEGAVVAATVPLGE